MRIKKIFKNWPVIIFFTLAIFPLLMILFILMNLIINSIPAVNELGLAKLFSTEISGVFGSNKGLYGLIPGIWGTLLVVTIAMGIAVPVSLAFAIFASEFPLGFLGRGMRTILGICAGIPPIIYALTAVIFAELIIIPKFCGIGLPPGSIPPEGMYWWKNAMLPYHTSTLLGGMMLSMILIPFLSPLFDDAIKDVPHSLKEASLSLGANRWHTLTNVTIPYASAGLFSAGSLGVLKAMGDVVIVGLVIGFESPLPVPLWDILENVAPLTSTGAGFAGGFTLSITNPTRVSASYFTGLVLILIAFLIIVLIPILQTRFKRRFSK